MHYRLKNNIALRGWQKLPYALTELDSGNVMFLGKVEFDALSMCDGQTEIGPISTLPIYMEVIDKAKEMGIIEECPKMHLMPWQKYHQYPSRYIDTAHWSITGRCNYKCRHCYMSAPDAKFGELSREQCFSIIDQLHECGIKNVTLTGGEALYRDDFWDLADRLIAYGIQIKSIHSNGELVTKELLDALERRRIMPTFSISFDGVGQHDWLRGIEGSEKTVINAFKLCRDRGYATNTELCLHQYNKHTLRESVNLLASLGVGSVKTNPASMSGAWIENAGDANLTIQELYEVYLDYIPHYFEDGAPMNIQLGGFFYGRKGEMKYMLPSVKCDGAEKAGRQVICGHARKVMYISAEGRILPCMSLSGLDVQKDYPLVTEIGLVKCLTNSTYMRLIGSTVDDFLENCTECAECEFKYQCCTGCRASAMDSGGDLMGPDRACCEFFKGGIISRIIEAAKGAECVNYQISE